jgi:hypothetical protein
MLKKVTYIFLLMYLFFIPLGPLAIPTPLGVNLDVLFGIILFFLTVPLFKNLNQYSYNMTIVVGILLIATLISVLLSQNIEFSLINWLIASGYLYVSLIIPVVYFSKLENISVYIVLAAFIIGVYIIFSYETIQVVGRYNVSKSISLLEGGNYRLDPNMTAIGLSFSLLFMRKIQYRYSYIIFFVVIVAVLILGSRTAILSLAMAIILSRFYLLLYTKNYKDFFLKILNTIVLFLFLYWLFPDIFQSYYLRAVSGSNNETRLDLLISGYNDFTENVKTLFFGVGFMLRNPHNEIMRMLFSSGLLGFLSSIIWMLYLLFLISKISIIETKVQAVSIMTFLIFATQTYGHTKFVYVSYMFILMLYLQDKHIKISAQA